MKRLLSTVLTVLIVLPTTNAFWQGFGFEAEVFEFEPWEDDVRFLDVPAFDCGENAYELVLFDEMALALGDFDNHATILLGGIGFDDKENQKIASLYISDANRDNELMRIHEGDWINLDLGLGEGFEYTIELLEIDLVHELMPGMGVVLKGSGKNGCEILETVMFENPVELNWLSFVDRFILFEDREWPTILRHEGDGLLDDSSDIFIHSMFNDGISLWRDFFPFVSVNEEVFNGDFFDINYEPEGEDLDGPEIRVYVKRNEDGDLSLELNRL